MAQAQSYHATLEASVDFMAADLEKLCRAKWVWKLVDVKEKAKRADRQI
jgi:hypothetical protein